MRQTKESYVRTAAIILSHMRRFLCVDKLRNSIAIAQGAKVTVEGGFVLTVGKETVDISGGDLYNLGNA